MRPRCDSRHATGIGFVAAMLLLVGGCGQPSNDAGQADSASATEAPAPRFANPDDYVSRGAQYPRWGFTTPSSKWMCVIGVYPSGGDEAACVVDRNQGPLPIAGVPFARSPTGQTSSRLPNAITVSEGSDPVFRSIAEPVWGAADDPRILPYGAVLQVGGFSCNVQQSGVSCRSDGSGMGFTFSTAGYRFAYTDVPG